VGGGDGCSALGSDILLFNLFIALKDVVDLSGSESQALASQPGDVSFRSALIRFCYLTKHINNLIVSDPGLIYFGRIGRWNKDGEFAMRLLEMRRYFSGCALTELLVKLGQLPSDNYWSVNQFSKFPKCLLQLVWRLEEHRQPVPGTSSGLLEPPFTVFSPNWWEAKKGEAMGSDAGRRNPLWRLARRPASEPPPGRDPRGDRSDRDCVSNERQAFAADALAAPACS